MQVIAFYGELWVANADTSITVPLLALFQLLSFVALLYTWINLFSYLHSLDCFAGIWMGCHLCFCCWRAARCASLPWTHESGFALPMVAARLCSLALWGRCKAMLLPAQRAAWQHLEHKACRTDIKEKQGHRIFFYLPSSSSLSPVNAAQFPTKEWESISPHSRITGWLEPAGLCVQSGQLGSAGWQSAAGVMWPWGCQQWRSWAEAYRVSMRRHGSCIWSQLPGGCEALWELEDFGVKSTMWVMSQAAYSSSGVDGWLHIWYLKLLKCTYACCCNSCYYPSLKIWSLKLVIWERQILLYLNGCNSA